MHILATTLGFLVLFAFFAAVQVQKLYELYYGQIASTAQYEAVMADLTEEMEAIASKAYATQQKGTSSKKKKNDGDRTKTEHEHASLVLALPSEGGPTATSKASTLLLQRLMLQLYGRKAFFLDGAKGSGLSSTTLAHTLAERLLETAAAMQKPPQDACALANVDLNDPVLQELIYRILKGSCPIDSEAAEDYPSLLEFIEVDKGKKHLVSIFLAYEEVLEALFVDPNTVKRVMEAREELARDKKNNGSVLAQEMERRFGDALPSDIDRSCISF